MYFPRYWQRATVKGQNREGKESETMAWGWSDTSNEEAFAKANERALAALLRLPADQRGPKTYYDGRPFREPILEDVSHDGVKTLITRNSFGCDVLNTDRVGFGDIDYEPPQTSFLGGLFGRAKKEAAEHRQRWEQDTLARLRDWQLGHTAWGFRVYRTAGGIRVLVTSRLLEPDAEAKDWLESIGSDPLYQRLCANQQSFRARLTPKPWRCGVKQLDVGYPCATPKDEQLLDGWLEEYRAISSGFAVCELIDAVGPARVEESVRPVLELHDMRTSVGSGMPLG